MNPQNKFNLRSSVVLILLLSTICASISLGESKPSGDTGTNEADRNVLDFVEEFMMQTGGEVNFKALAAESSLNSNETESKFLEFIAQHKPHVYSAINASEYALRRSIFAKNLARIDLLNHLEQGSAVYKLNKFSDLEYDEFAKHKLGYKRISNINQDLTSSNEVDFKVLWDQLLKEEGKSELELIRDAPEQFDWRHTEGVVSPIKNQGECGSCWAFSVIGTIEGQLKIKSNVTVSLSEQQLVDCDKINKGCGGGFMHVAYDQIIKLGGLETEQDYPYKARSSVCKMHANSSKYSITSFASLSKDEDKLKVWLHKRGPISVGINASVMQHYHRGVSHPDEILCNPNKLDHAVLIVGFGVEQTRRGPLPYWLIKNSWGVCFGEKGYYRLLRGKNVCGVAEEPTTALIS